ncbi:DUF4192 domain-containing protein [Dactylosporangium sucinum]|uniref:DUF4192 domain-containing protein n=1 Tax=Dactylosporangium sucinum TaxID=1424081 RepID=A0A917X7J7_9ACTN|nr:DUF4192 domain-containing protein [Dactylosporangium sucinum]GGM83890.1 hypothetical protein GCM10007977_101620 [Dactylosporangium sucinum]
MTTTTAESPRLRLRSQSDILAATPYLLGFHPTDSLVVLGLRGPGLHFHVRGDLPDDRDDGDVLAEEYAVMFARHGVDGVVLVAYGPVERAEPFLLAVAAAMRRHGITAAECLRAHDGRFWSYTCDVPGCCPAEGRPFDVTTSAAAAEAILAGMVALPDRDTAVRGLAGPSGAALAAIEEATDRAGLRLVRLATEAAGATEAPGATGAVAGGHGAGGLGTGGVGPAAVRAGAVALAAALKRYRAGDRLTDDEVAWLTLLLHVLPFRDQAWLCIDRDGPAGRAVHRQLWTDLVRRAEPGLVAPPAMLLAYLSWRSGDGLRAAIAVDRALEADPQYRGARLMAEILDRALPPSALPPLGRPRRRAVRRRMR